MNRRSATQQFFEYWTSNAILNQWTCFNSQTTNAEFPSWIVYDFIAQTQIAGDDASGYNQASYQLRIYGNEAGATDDLATLIDEQLNFVQGLGFANYRTSRVDARLEGTRNGKDVWVALLEYDMTFDYSDEAILEFEA